MGSRYLSNQHCLNSWIVLIFLIISILIIFYLIISLLNFMVTISCFFIILLLGFMPGKSCILSLFTNFMKQKGPLQHIEQCINWPLTCLPLEQQTRRTTTVIVKNTTSARCQNVIKWPIKFSMIETYITFCFLH